MASTLTSAALAELHDLANGITSNFQELLRWAGQLTRRLTLWMERPRLPGRVTEPQLPTRAALPSFFNTHARDQPRQPEVPPVQHPGAVVL